MPITMRKRIAVIFGEITNEYGMEMIRHFHEAARAYDYDIFAFSSFSTFDKYLRLYAEGERSVINIMDPENFDGIIIEESRLNLLGMEKELNELFLTHSEKLPVVYLKSLKNGCFGVMPEDRKTMYEVTRHFIDEHGFTKVYHLAGRRELDDSHERREGYLQAMREAGLDVTERMTYWGTYWYDCAGAALDHFLDGTEDYPEAIVCSNDYMAVGMIRELQGRGKRVPEDVCVSGFDNARDYTHVKPAPTTVSPADCDMAYRAVETIVRKNRGEDVASELKVGVTGKLILRGSCGCGADDSLEECIKRLHYMDYYIRGLDNGLFIENAFSTAFDLDDIFLVADSYFKHIHADTGYLCLCSDAFSKKERPIDLLSAYTDKMILTRIFYHDRNKNYKSPHTEFERAAVLPPEYFDSKEPTLFIIYPIHALNRVYGYMVLHFEGDDWPNKFTRSYTNALGAAIENYNISQQYTDMDKIRAAYLADELTGLSNRRGYEQRMQMALDRTFRRQLYLSVVSIDLDNLKYINDNFGHTEGDFAICFVADAIRSLISSDDTAARNGGDEFGVILVSDNETYCADFTKNFLAIFDNNPRTAEKPYPVHASIGSCTVSDAEHNSLQEALKIADERMYANKKEYKAAHPEFNMRLNEKTATL